MATNNRNHKETKTIIKCPQETELTGNHCKLILNHFENNKVAEIKKL